MKLSELITARDEIDAATKKLDEKRTKINRRILKLLENKNKKSIEIRVGDDLVTVTRVAPKKSVWNQPALRTWLTKRNKPLKRVFRNIEIFDEAGLNTLFEEGIITPNELNELEEFHKFKELTAHPRITRKKNVG